MKKDYIKPELELVLLPFEDVLATSGDSTGDDIWPDGGLEL